MSAQPLFLTVGDREVRVSNPDKVMFPGLGVRKRDLVAYYLAVGDGILGALRNRPTTLRRYPDGLGGESFYQKRAPKGAPDWVRTVRIAFPSGRHADEIRPTELAVIAWAANLGTLEFHPWPVSGEDVDHPDLLRIDLDPQPGTDFGDAVVVAGLAREVLAEFGYSGRPKTSGGRGLHIIVPIEPAWTFTEVRRAAIAFAREVERRRPELVTTAWWKEERGEKVFVDYNQTARDRTIVAAYSVRADPRATVSAPVRWPELDQVAPGDFTVMTMPARFAADPDPHADLPTGPYRLDPLLELADQQRRDHGLGDMPYPPDYPKMPGEPPRVRPSRRRMPVTDDERSPG